MLRNKRQRRGARSAFTLIEIMVATVIMVIMVGIVIQITGEVLRVWNRSTGKLSANAEARIALDLLTQDLETAVFRNNGMQWLRAENDTVQGPAPEVKTATVALRLFSPALDRPEGVPGDVCAVAYQLDFRDPVTGEDADENPDDRLFILYRLVVDPETTFNACMGPGMQGTLPDKDTPTWGGEPILGADPIGSNYLSSNIVSFEIEFHVADDGVAATDTTVPGDTIYGGTDATVGPQGPADPYARPLDYADVKLTILSDEGAELLQNINRIAPRTVEDVIREYGEVFTRRVHFMARPL